MSIEKKTVRIDEDLFKELEKRFKEEENSLGLINIKNTDEFIEYILKNFSNSSKQFEGLTEEQKQALNNVDINNLNISDLFEQIGKISKKEKPGNDNNNNNGNLIN